MLEIEVPGSKSISNRALILSALCNQHVQIHNLADCDDTNYMLKGLEEIKNSEQEVNIFTGNAGTTTRFLTAYATLQNKLININGDKRMQERPIQVLANALNQLGAKVETTSGCPPVTIRPQILKGGEITIPGDISSQYISALLMTLPLAEQQSTINIDGEACSIPYISITLELLKQFGIKIENHNFKKYIITSQKPQRQNEFTVEADASGASYIGAYAALHPEKPVIIKNLNRSSIQGDIKFLDYLEQMGCSIKESANGTQITGPKELKTLGEVDMNQEPDLVMTFAVLAMFSPGTTKITNVPNLRIKETDRLAALENEIKKFGIEVSTSKDSINITGNPNLTIQNPIHISTYEDHRIAMCFAVLKDLMPITIENPDCVSKSYPTFWQDLDKLINY